MSAEKRDLALELVRAFSGQRAILTIPRPFITLIGDHEAALFFSQCLHLSDRTSDDEDWFDCTDARWFEETGLSVKQVARCRKRLGAMKLVETERRGVPARMFYRVSLERLRDLLEYKFSPKGTTDNGGQNSPPKAQNEAEKASSSVVPKGHNKSSPKGVTSDALLSVTSYAQRAQPYIEEVSKGTKSSSTTTPKNDKAQDPLVVLKRLVKGQMYLERLERFPDRVRVWSQADDAGRESLRVEAARRSNQTGKTFATCLCERLAESALPDPQPRAPSSDLRARATQLQEKTIQDLLDAGLDEREAHAQAAAVYVAVLNRRDDEQKRLEAHISQLKLKCRKSTSTHAHLEPD